MSFFKMNIPKCVLPVCMLLAAPQVQAVDFQLAKLEAALDSARTQTDMNLKSRDLGLYLDAKLSVLEERIKKDLDSESLKLFVAASNIWKKYRDAQVLSEGDVFRDGSIQPLIHNSVYIRLTKERLAALYELNPEGKYRE